MTKHAHAEPKSSDTTPAEPRVARLRTVDPHGRTEGDIRAVGLTPAFDAVGNLIGVVADESVAMLGAPMPPAVADRERKRLERETEEERSRQHDLDEHARANRQSARNAGVAAAGGRVG